MMNNPRKYQVGDTIPGRGVVIDVWLTAYHVRPGAVDLDDALHGGEACVIIPFYGPNGVDDVVPVAGFVTFSDGSWFASGGRVVCRNRLPWENAK